MSMEKRAGASIIRRVAPRHSESTVVQRFPADRLPSTKSGIVDGTFGGTGDCSSFPPFSVAAGGLKDATGSASGQRQCKHQGGRNRNGLEDSVRYDIVQVHAEMWLVRRNGVNTARRSSCLGALSLAIQLARTEWTNGSVLQAMVREKGADGLWRLSVAFGTQSQCSQEEGSASGSLRLT